jgi:hypothetical protein
MTQQQKRRPFRLDIDDMERRLVDFRVMMDRERRRCQQAQMTDKFEKLLRDKLTELRTNEATNAGGEQVAQNPDNEIKLTTLDQEGLNRLANFLRYTVEMCKRIEQQELMQDVLRKALQETRRKRFKSQQEEPSAPIEPFCLFCASSLATPAANGCQDTSHHQQHQNQNQMTVDIGFMSQLNAVATVTPPPSIAPTPEVGEQVYTPIPSTTPPLPGKEVAPENGVANNKQKQPQPQPQPQAAANIAKTNASSAQQAKQVPPAAAASEAAQFVMPSDDDSTSSSDDDDAASVRNVLDWANRSKSLFGAANNELDGGDANERRCSTPLGDDPDGSMPQLVIDESSAKLRSSPIKRPSSSGAKHNIVIQAQPNSSKSIKPVLKGNKTIATTSVTTDEAKAQLQHNDSTATRSSTINNASAVSSSSKLEESTSQQNSQGARKKFQPRRRNIGNKRN